MKAPMGSIAGSARSIMRAMALPPGRKTPNRRWPRFETVQSWKLPRHGALPRLARPSPGWRLRIQPQVSEDLLDHRPLEEGRDDLPFPGAAVRAVLRLDVEGGRERSQSADGPLSSLLQATLRRSY